MFHPNTFKVFKRLTTLVWTIPGDTQTTLMPDSAGSRLLRILLNIICNRKCQVLFHSQLRDEW